MLLLRANGEPVDYQTLLKSNKVPLPGEDPILEQLQVQILEAKKRILELKHAKEEEYRRRRLWYWVPSPKQLEFFKHSGKKRRAGFCGNRFGKGFRPDQKVMTPQGSKTLRDLKVGDEIFSGSGKIERVLGKYERGVLPFYKFIFDDGTEVLCDYQHLWKVKTPSARFAKDRPGYGKWSVLEANEVAKRTGDYAKQKFSIPVVESLEFPKVNVSVDPYILGCLLGDGSITDNCVDITTGDVEILEAFVRAGYTIGYVSKYGNRLSKLQLRDELKSLGVWNKTSHTKFVPKQYLANSDEVRLGVLQGLLDTDGSVYENGHGEYSSVSPHLAQAVLFLLRSFGVNPTVTKKELPNGPSFRLLFSPKKEFFRLSRKKERVLEREFTRDRIIQKVEVAGNYESVCVAVSGEQTFLLDSLVVTHNSTLGVVEDVCWLIGYRPFFAVGHPLRTLGIPTHGVKGLVVAEDWDKVKEIFTNDDSKERQGKFQDFLPEDFIKKTHRNEKGIIDQITVVSEVDGHKRESIVYFDTVKSYKNAPAGFESSDWDFIHIDEPVLKELWTAVSRGLVDRDGYSWWLFTPLKEVWMYNETVENAKNDPENYWWFEATMDDNPTLTEGAKRLYLNQLPEDERAARRAGKPLAYGRLVFHQYDPTTHDFDGHLLGWPTPSRPPEKDCMVAYALDTHPQTPHAGLFVAVSALGDIDIYDEIYEKGTITKLSDTVKAKLQGVRVQYGLCEPAAWNEDQASGRSYADMFAEAGLDLIPASKRKEDAILQTQLLLGQRKRTIRIHTRCKRLRWEMFNHYFDKDNKPEDKNDHMIECLRRLVIHDGLIYYPPTWGGKVAQFTNDKYLNVPKHLTELGKIGSLTHI